MSNADLQVENHGSIFLLRSLTTRGTKWVDEHIATDEAMYFGGALVVEPRYIIEIAEGAERDGLSVA